MFTLDAFLAYMPAGQLSIIRSLTPQPMAGWAVFVPGFEPLEIPGMKPEQKWSILEGTFNLPSSEAEYSKVLSGRCQGQILL